jgi:predicted transcriptional regulator
MAKFQLKIQAREIRKKGISIVQIAKQLGVTKGSVSLWCRDIVLSPEQQMILQKQRGSVWGRWVGAEANKQKRLDSIEKNRKEAFSMIGKVTKRDLTVAALCLFWGEGSKTGSRFTFINSDPAMIKIMKHFLTDILHVEEDRIRATIQINHIHKPRIKEVTSFWSKYLGLPLKQFRKPHFIMVTPKKVYDNYDVYKGIMRLQVLRGSNLQYKMLGLIEAFQHGITSG